MEACEIGLGDHWTASFDMAVLFLVEGTSLPGVAKVLVTKQATTALIFLVSFTANALPP